MPSSAVFKNFEIYILLITSLLKYSICQYQTPRCSSKLETALEHILRRSELKSNSRTFIDLSPYSVYHTLYGQSGENNDENPESNLLNEKLDNFYEKFTSYSSENFESKELPIKRVEVADLRVRLPQNMRWVQVDKCYFNASNRTLDTRLLFPDLTISGKVILHPAGGRCNMILRLRRAGIEFRTVPLISSFDESRRSGSASVRTDSHFAEPGFLSVFAHGCQGPYGVKVRQNSKRRQFDYKQYNANVKDLKWIRNGGRKYNINGNNERYEYDDSGDFMEFNDEILDIKESNMQDNSRMLSNLLGPFGDPSNIRNDRRNYNYGSQHTPHKYGQNNWHNADRPSLTQSEEINDALMHELEKLFSMGVRGLLTTYMQKALQPAIKETLMQNMGYTISYG